MRSNNPYYKDALLSLLDREGIKYKHVDDVIEVDLMDMDK